MSRVIMFVSLCASLSLASCSSKTEEKEEGFKFSVTSPLRKDTLVIRDYVCQIRAIQHIEVRALEKGYLQTIFVDEGKFVRQGQIMFQVMPLMYKAELQKAEAEAKFAEIEFLTTKSLADSNVVSPNELALAKAKFDKAKAEVSLAQVHLGFTEIKAPFDGIMDRFQVRLGSLVNEGDLLTTMSDNSKMWVYFNVPEAEYLNFRMSEKKDSLMKVNLLMANNLMFDHIGVVQTIEADFNNETGNVQMTVPLINALIIPQKVTFEILEKKYVFVVDKDKVIHQREITIAAEMPDLYIIKEGLLENERIVLEGIRKVKDNEKLEEFEYHDPKVVIPHLKVYVE